MQLQDLPPYELAVLLVPFLGVIVSRIVTGEMQKLKLLVYSQGAASVLAVIGFVANICGIIKCSTLCSGMINFDQLAFILVALISFIAAVVICYSERYLGGDKTRAQFMGSLMVLACAANLLVLSNSLFISFFAWSAISLLLFRTMSLRGEAKNSARTVFRHHLASDLCLLVAFVLLYKLSGSTELSKLQPNMSSTASAHLLKTIAVCLIVISMSIKSALYPFHRWLLATLDAPTPLSGLLHAGIVNVAAILAARLFPVLQDSTPVLFTWGLLSALSATLGTLSMSAQFDVKRKLVYSTVGQMGFMCLQCALGAIPAAIFHLIAHGLFKCHMFLQSGAGVAEGLVKRRYGTNKTSSTDHKWLIAFVMILVSALSLTYNSALSSLTGQTVFSASIAMLAIVFSLPSIRRTGALLFTLTSLILMSMIGISLSTAHCLEKSIVQFGGAPNLKVMGSCVLLFALLNLGLELKAKSNIGKALYVHALNGFYVAQLKHELKPKTKSPQSA